MATATSDVLWHDTNGNVSIWEMNGTTITNLASSFVSQVPLAGRFKTRK